MSNIERLQFAEGLAREGKEFGFENNPEMARQIVDVIDRQYEVRTELGRGKSGEVWIGDFPTLQEVCVKIIHNPTISPNNLQREFTMQDRAVQAGVRSPRPWLYVEGSEEQADKRSYQALAMETLHGRTMQEQLEWMQQHDEKFSVEQYRELVASIKKQIEVLHKAHIYHRDLHLGNLYYTEDGQVYIIDYGHAVDGTGIHNEDDLYREVISRDGRQVTESYPRDEQVIPSLSKEILERELVHKKA